MASESKESDGADVIVLDDGANNGLNLAGAQATLDGVYEKPRFFGQFDFDKHPIESHAYCFFIALIMIVFQGM